MLTGPVASLTNILPLSKTKTHGSPPTPPSFACPDAPVVPPLSITNTQGRAAGAAAFQTDRRTVAVCGREISWVWQLCGALIQVFFFFGSVFALFYYLDALSWASTRLKGWQCSKTTEWFWCTDIHGSQMNLTFLRRSWTFVDECWEMLNMAAIIPAKHHRVNMVIVSTSGLTLEFRHCGWRLFIYLWPLCLYLSGVLCMFLVLGWFVLTLWSQSFITHIRASLSM